MNKFFEITDRIKPIYDKAYDIILVLCKLLLVSDILITVMAVLGRYVSFLPDPSWSEEVVLTLMAYMAVLSASLAIRSRSHIRMTAFDKLLPKNLVVASDILADLGVLLLAGVMIVVGWRYASLIGSKGNYISMPTVSRFWMYFQIPLAGVAMAIFQLEVLVNDIKRFFIDEVDMA